MLTEARHAGDFIVGEAPGFYSRDALTVALSQTLAVATVCARIGVAANIVSAVAADAGNTASSGALTLDVSDPVSAAAKNGEYRIVCIEPASNGGMFEVSDPDGVQIGRVAVGATFNDQIKFVIADSTGDFAAGDAFTVTVVREDGTDEQAVALDLAGTDGSQDASCINVYPAVTDDTNTAKVTFLTRQCEVRAADLTWPGGITAAQKATAIEQLRAKGIILR